MPEISVIVPVYKVEQYLEECINSLSKQTFSDIEIILVDDGSPDNCGNICEEYGKKDERIKVIHQKNMGLSCARNAGLDVSKGNYICFVDSDDLIRNDMLDILLKELINANADFIKSDFQSFKDDKEIKLKKQTILLNYFRLKRR